MSIVYPEQVADRLREMQRLIRTAVITSRGMVDSASVSKSTAADTIYGIDAVVDPIIEEYVERWAKQDGPIVVVAEGIEPESGKVFPHGAAEGDAALRIIMDPIDGTRGIMYDKRAAWSLAGAAANKGAATRLRDIEVAVMTELPTSKMVFGDVLWAIKGCGTQAVREPMGGGEAQAVVIRPSKADSILHGFATVSSFFPGTKELAAELMEFIISRLVGKADVMKATVFDDQYICTGGQFYELIVGHDRFIADLRPTFYAINGQPEGLCCHPYDCATWLVAEEAGVPITDGHGRPLDGPMDCVTGLSWAGFANESLRKQIEPLMLEFFGKKKFNHG